MTPVFDDQVQPSITIESIENHPLPVWYEDVSRARGNAAVSRKYNEVMGAFCGEDSWRSQALNAAYWESYDRFKERRILDEVWTHPLVWERPKDGEVIRKFSRATWVSDHEILGEVRDEIQTKLPTAVIILKRVVIFALGVLCGYGGALLWPIQ